MIKKCECCNNEEAVAIIMKRERFYEVEGVLKEVPEIDYYSRKSWLGKDFCLDTLITSKSGEICTKVYIGKKCLKFAVKIFDLLDKPLRIDIESLVICNEE